MKEETLHPREHTNHNSNKLAFDRRSFLKTSSLTAAGFAFFRMPLMAGPFTREDFDKLVPADKKLSEDWVKSLFARGERTVYRGKDLDKIGMPVGGICTGQLYLGGDGRLWHWDIFNQPIGGTGDSHYAKPMAPSSPLTQKFSLKIGDQTHTLDRDGFADITFRGEYPLGLVEYGSMTLAFLGQAPDQASADATAPFAERLSGSIGRNLKLAPGASATVRRLAAGRMPAPCGPGILPGAFA